MNVTKNYIGNYPKTRTENANSIAPTVRRFRTIYAKTQRCNRSAERPKEICTNTNVTNGFLKCIFLPKLRKRDKNYSTNNLILNKITNTTVERNFYQSFTQLAEHFSIEPMSIRDFDFPYNISLSISDIKEKLSESEIHWDSLSVVQEYSKTFFITQEKFDTQTTLYFIPIIPLYKMLREPKRKKVAHLLISVCSYLYHCADVPYYRQEESYLYWIYEMMKDWIEQDDENEESMKYKSELRQAEIIGDLIEQKLFNRINLELFEQRLNNFKIKDDFDQQCWNLASNVFELYKKHPTKSIFTNAPISENDPYNDDFENEIIGMEKYISFVADIKGSLYNNISDSINNEFNEYGALAEPTIIKRFNGTEISKANLDFENQIFPLLNELCRLLDHY